MPGASTPPAATCCKVGLIGCGGRGTGAAAQALNADQNVKLVAMADAFEDRLQTQPRPALQKDEAIAGKIDVPPERRFVGFDAYKQVIAGVRRGAAVPRRRTSGPLHLQGGGRGRQARLRREAGAPSMPPASARCWRPARRPKKKSLSVVSGLCLRYDHGFRETVKRIHDGAIGDVLALQANDYRGGDLGQAAAAGLDRHGLADAQLVLLHLAVAATSTSSSTSTSSTSAPG